MPTHTLKTFPSIGNAETNDILENVQKKRSAARCWGFYPSYNALNKINGGDLITPTKSSNVTLQDRHLTHPISGIREPNLTNNLLRGEMAANLNITFDAPLTEITTQTTHPALWKQLPAWESITMDTWVLSILSLIHI